MSIERCACWKVRGMFASVLLALIVHSMLSALVLAILFAYNANRTSGPGLPSVSNYSCSVYRLTLVNSFIDGTIVSLCPR